MELDFLTFLCEFTQNETLQKDFEAYTKAVDDLIESEGISEFEQYMDKTYGKHQWMSLGNDEEDGCGGYYIVTADVIGGYEGTGIYYTEWEEDENDE